MGKQSSVTRKAQQEAAWRNRLARYARSGQTVQAFCRSEAVPVGTFYGWQARLRGRDVKAVAVQQRIPAPSPFVDLGAVNGLAARAEEPIRDNTLHHRQGGIEVHLDLGGGMVLHIARR